MDVHPDMAALTGLVGTWEGEGYGSYPTIADFRYRERVTFTAGPKPFFGYQQVTTSPEGNPMHVETGYLRGVGHGAFEWVIAHPTGVVEVSPGLVEQDKDSITLRTASTTVGLSPSAKPVEGVHRRYTLHGDRLTYDLAMAAVGEPMTHHLDATLYRADR